MEKHIDVVSPKDARHFLAMLLNPKGVFQTVHRSKDGEIISIEEFHNLITNQGKNYILDAAFNTTALTTVTDQFWFIIYAGAFTPAAGSTYSSRGGAENTNYTEANRQAWSPGAAAAQSVTNATAATITANTGGIIVTGIGVVLSPTEAATVDDKGDTGTGDGILLSEATVSKTLAVSETLDITYTVSC